ncbi:MAG: hypothetical protein ACE5EY_17335, partial [Anaerolineae bacterium]
MTTQTATDRFLALLMQGVPADGRLPDGRSPQTQLDTDAHLRHSFCAAYFLADTQPGQNVHAFITETLPLLLRQLQRTTQRERVAFQGQVRGRVDWPATTKARAQNDANPALFVCRPPHRQHNTPENQLLKFLLDAIAQQMMQIDPVMLTAVRWTSAGASAPDWLAQRIDDMRYQMRVAQNHVRLRQVETPDKITPRHLIKARASKTELYGQVADLVMRYQQVVERADWTAVRPILAHTILLPQPGSPHADTCLALAARGFLEQSTIN